MRAPVRSFPTLFALLIGLPLVAGAADARLAIETLPDGTKRLNLSGTPGVSYQLQVSTNLLRWDRLADVPLSTSPLAYDDAEEPAPSHRFYRLRQADPVDPGERQLLLGLAGSGPMVSGLNLANQAITGGNVHLMIVDPTKPDPAVTLEPAGAWGGDTVNFIHQNSVVEATVDPATGEHRRTRPRYTIYAKENRLWKFDHRGAASGQPWTTMPTTEICSGGFALRRLSPDYADASRSWVFFGSPGPSGSCFAFPDDTRTRALRLDMGPTDEPLTIPRPLAPIHDRTGGLTGFVVQDGGRIQRVDAEFTDAVDLFPVGGTPIVLNGATNWASYSRGYLYGTHAPGLWLFVGIHGSTPETLMGYDLANGGAPVPVLPLGTTASVGTGTLFGDWTDTDGTNVYLAINRGLTSSIVRVDPAFAVLTLAHPGTRVNELSVTDGHVVFRTDRQLRSVPKTGGGDRVLFELPSGEEYVPRFRMRRAARTVEHPTVRQRTFVTGGNLVWFESIRTRPSPSRSAVYSLAADGSESEPLRLADTAMVTWAAPPSMPWCVEGGAHAVYLANHWTPVAPALRSDFGGQRLWAVNAANRAELFEVGRLPEPMQTFGGLSSPARLIKWEVNGAPLQFGEPALIPVSGRVLTPTGASAGNDLLFFHSDAPGLVAVTHFGID